MTTVNHFSMPGPQPTQDMLLRALDDLLAPHADDPALAAILTSCRAGDLRTAQRQVIALRKERAVRSQTLREGLAEWLLTINRILEERERKTA